MIAGLEITARQRPVEIGFIFQIMDELTFGLVIHSSHGNVIQNFKSQNNRDMM